MTYRAFLIASLEAIEVVSAGSKVVDLRVDRMRQRRYCCGLTRAHNMSKTLVFGDFPADADRPVRHSAVRRVRIGRQARPHHHPVGGGIAGRDAEIERIRRHARSLRLPRKHSFDRQ